MGAIIACLRLLYGLVLFLNRIIAALTHDRHRRGAEFARLDQTAPLESPTLRDEACLLLGVSPFNQILRVRPTKKRRELGNLLVVAPTRGGKGLLAVTQLLTWPHSVIVNDIKGELFQLTAGYRRKLGRVFVIDPRGYGHQYDPLEGRVTDGKLYSSAKQLLYEPHEGEGTIFTQRATKMLTLLFLAAREANRQLREERYRLLPFVGQMSDLGLNDAARILNGISPEIARRFLNGNYDPEKDYDQNKFLCSAWETLSSRLFPLLTEEVVRCFNGSDFTAKDIITSKEPMTVYLRWPEADLLALAPLVRLVWGSLIKNMINIYDNAPGFTPEEKGCYPVMGLLDELGRTAINDLPDDSTTVVGRGISLVCTIQSPSQLDAAYGSLRAETLRDNCNTQIFYRPGNNRKTAKEIADWLGPTIGYTHSESEHNGVISTGKSEREVPLMTEHEVRQMEDEDILISHHNKPPIRAKRMDHRLFPELKKRLNIPPPELPVLPPVDAGLPDFALQEAGALAPAYNDPDLVH